MKKTDVAIIGGGAAGLACAVRLKERAGNLSVTIIEGGERLGRKLSATGNGQGNLSNADMSASRYHGGGSALVHKICCENPDMPFGLFDSLFVTDASGRIYPSGRQASSLTDCLIRKTERLKVDVVKGVRVTGISEGFLLELSDGGALRADKVVLCTGGKAAKNYGSDGSGYALAQALGHSVTPLYPSLVQLKTETRHIKTLKGIRTECAVRVLFGDGEPIVKMRGDVIFTDYGVSGNAVFYVSSYIAGRQNCTLSLEFLPDFSRGQILENLKKRKAEGCADGELLCGTLHNQLGRAVCRRAGGDVENIADAVKDFRLAVEGTLGFDYAQVTRGGVRMDEVDGSLQSKKIKGLYFAGEILDVDGDCGGYNLHWAFCSGIHVADALIK